MIPLASSAITVTPEASKTAIALQAFNPQTGAQTNPNVTTATYGQSIYLLRTDVTDSAGTACAPVPVGQSACPSGNVTITDNGNPLDGGTLPLTALDIRKISRLMSLVEPITFRRSMLEILVLTRVQVRAALQLRKQLPASLHFPFRPRLR